MITYTIHYNKVYRGFCNLITEERKGHYIYISNDLNGVYIDNVKVGDYESINQITFTVGGYKQIIDCNTNGKLKVIEREV